MNSGALVTVDDSENAGTGSARFIYEDALAMWARLWARSRPNAVWFINQDVEPSLMGMTMFGDSTSGRIAPVYLPAGRAGVSPYATLFGRPVVPIEQCQTLGTLGDIILMDPGEYVLIDKGGIDVQTSIHVRFIYDESAIRFVYRCDGQPAWNAALTPFKGSNTLSPFVVCDTRE
jgi:HK97 family phage major capsid protein